MKRALMGLVVAAGVMPLAGCGDRCEEPGVACTWAGGLDPGLNGDGLSRLETRLYYPMDIEFGPDGDAWLLDWNNHRVRRIGADGLVQTVVGNFIGDGDEDMNDLTAEGAPARTVNLNHPTDLVFDAEGRMIIAAWHNHKLRVWNPDTDQVHVMCGRGPSYSGDDGPVEKAYLNLPKNLVFDRAGNLYFLDQGNQRIRRVTTDGVMETVVGTGEAGFSGDGGDPLQATLNFENRPSPAPSGALAIDADDNLYIADGLNHRIRKVDLKARTIETIAGTGEAGLAGDGGPALQAKFNHPRDMEIGPDGRLYVADTSNHVVRAIDLTSGVVTRVAGTGTSGEGNEDLAINVALNQPYGLGFDKDGVLFIADAFNDRIVRVAP